MRADRGEDDGLTHKDIHNELCDMRAGQKVQFRWMIGIAFTLVMTMGGGFTSAMMDQQETLGITNAHLAVAVRDLNQAVARQVKFERWMENRRSEVVSIMTTMTSNQMKMVDRLHEHEKDDH
jgi:hypothetical protein